MNMTTTPTATPITTHNQNEASLNSFLKLGNWIYKYNTKISNIRLKIKYYKLILDNIDMELNEIEKDYNNLNDCLKLINIEYDINKTSVLAYKKLIKNKQNILSTIQELQNEEQYFINEIYN